MSDGFSIVEVAVAPGPLGILLNGDDPSRPALLEGFAPVSTDGDRGDVERDGRVAAGAQLVGVNEYDFDEWKLSFAEIGQVLRETSELQRMLRFRVPLPSPLPVTQPTSVTHVYAASSPLSSSFHEIDESEVEAALGGSAHLLSPPSSTDTKQSWSVKDLRSPRSVADPSTHSSGGSSPQRTASATALEGNQLESSLHVDRASRLVAVDAPAGPLGLNLDGSVTDKALLVGFVALPDGSKGAVELSGGVLPGSTLVEINGEDVSQLPLSDITATLGALSGEPRQLVFLLPDPVELARAREAAAKAAAARTLLKKSSRSMPRYVEDLSKRRKLELALVLKFDSTKLKRRECWMLVDAAWMNKWVEFAARDGALPGPITNDALLEDDWEAKADGKIPGRPDTPRDDLQVTTHYRGVTPMVWCLFAELHGINPKLPVLARYTLDAYSEPPRKSDLSGILTECRLKAASLVLELREACEVRVDE